MRPGDLASSRWIYAIGWMGAVMMKSGMITGAVEERLAAPRRAGPFHDRHWILPRA